jgi:hypothetical protein
LQIVAERVHEATIDSVIVAGVSAAIAEPSRFLRTSACIQHLSPVPYSRRRRLRDYAIVASQKMRSVIEPAEAQLNPALCSDFEGLLVAPNSEVNPKP